MIWFHDIYFLLIPVFAMQFVNCIYTGHSGVCQRLKGVRTGDGRGGVVLMWKTWPCLSENFDLTTKGDQSRGGSQKSWVGSCAVFFQKHPHPIFLGCTWRHRFLKSKDIEPPKLSSSSGMRGSKFISVKNFSAQKLASSRNRHILNFRVLTVRDIKLWTCLSKNIFFSWDF